MTAASAVGAAGGSPAFAAFDAVVLAGGRGARLGGADKPGLVVGGRTLAARVVSAAAEAGAGRVVVVGPPRPDLRSVEPAPPGGLVFVREDPPGSGPAPALSRGIAEARAGIVAVLAADLPFLRARHLQALLPAASGAAAGAIMVDDAGREQWLIGCWQAEVLRQAARGYRGRSLRGLLWPLRPARLRWELAQGEAPPWADCDTDEDLARARLWHERGRGEGEDRG